MSVGRHNTLEEEEEEESLFKEEEECFFRHACVCRVFIFKDTGVRPQGSGPTSRWG